MDEAKMKEQGFMNNYKDNRILKKRNYIKRICGIIVVVIGLASCILLASQRASAVSANDAIVKKTLAQGVYRCYNAGVIVQNMNPILDVYNGASSFLTDAANNDENFVPLVSGISEIGYSVSDSGLSCSQFFTGGGYAAGGRNAGILATTGHSAPTASVNNIAQIEEFLEGMGYSVAHGSSGNCLGINYRYYDNAAGAGNERSYQTNLVCRGTNGTISTQSGNTDTNSPARLEIAGNQVCLAFDPTAGIESRTPVYQRASCIDFPNSNDAFGQTWLHGIVGETSSNPSTNTKISCNVDGTCTFERTNYTGPSYTATYNFSSTADTPMVFASSAASNDAATLAPTERAGLQAANFLLGQNYENENALRLTESEKRILYQDYLEDYFGVTVTCSDAEFSNGNSSNSIRWFENGTMKNCRYSQEQYDSAKNSTKKANTVDGNGYLEWRNDVGVEKLIQLIGELPADYTEEQLAEMSAVASAGTYASSPSSMAGGASGNNDLNKQCHQNSGLDGIAWIVCPLISNGTKTAGGLESLIDTMLSTDTTLYKSDSAAYSVWGDMRSVANVIIILVLIVVIFSQLTGFGIDNYGIKRILPRLIVMAIVINLSFVFCQVLIDLSNIVGSGLDDLFEASASGMTVNPLAVIVTGLLGTLSATMAVAGLGTIALGPMIILSLLLSLLTVLISLLMFFVTLSARAIIVIVFTAIAPIALACYILPNTQSIFKRWWKIFSAALLVYPICGALYGISYVIRGIFGSSTDILQAILALLAPFLPFFVMPSLLKSAMSGLGAAGGAIAAIGNGLKRSASSANNVLRNSDMYKDEKRTAAINRARRGVADFRAVTNGGGNLRQRMRYRLSGFGETGRQRAFARNQQFVERSSGEDIEAARIGMREETGNYDTNIMGGQLNNYLDRIDGGENLSQMDENQMYALVSQLSQQSGGGKQIQKALEKRTGRSAQMMGAYLASNAKAKQSLEHKSQRTASRISDIAAGVIDANTDQDTYDNMNNEYLEYRRKQTASGQPIASEADWRHSQYEEYRAGQIGKGLPVMNESTWTNGQSKMTVIQNIARNVLDKDKDFVTQSGSDVGKLIQALPQERINRMASNSNLFSYGDVADGTRETVLSRMSNTYEDTSDPTGKTTAEIRYNKDFTGFQQYNKTKDQWDDMAGVGNTAADLKAKGYVLRSEQEKQRADAKAAAPKVLGTRKLRHSTTGNIIRVREMSDGTVEDIDNPGTPVDIRDYD